MFDKIAIVCFLTWSFINYGPPPILLYYYDLLNYVNFENFFSTINIVLFNGFCREHWLNDSDSELESEIEMDTKAETNKNEQIYLTRYEDKYVNVIRSLNKEWIFTDDENNRIIELTEEFFNGSKDNLVLRLEEINKEICELEKDINDEEDCIDDYNSDENSKQNIIEYLNKSRREKIESLNEEIKHIQSDLNSEEIINKLKNDAINNARNYIISERLDKLKSCYVIEKTPLGNVLMIYDKNCESFKYYADSTIPYRYLEPVARKYIKFFNCRPIFVDMEEELRLFEEKWEKEQEIKKQKEEEEKQKENVVSNDETKSKKNVFVKFKSYNKDAGGKISMAPPPKNSIPNKQVTENKENEKILLKERANRYTYEGKFANFNFIQKVERKVFNKKLGLTFAEFKMLNNKLK
jgi:hypothetical protein